MRHPPLEPLAISAARFLAGWELLHDAPALTRLGTGRLELDLLRGFCHHQLRHIPPLNITGILRNRLVTALDEIPLHWTRLTQAKAEVEVRLEIREQSGALNPRRVWAGFGDVFVFCALDVKLVLATDEGTWTGAHQGALEWPRDWATPA
jgi:hypothetical protein